MNFLLNLKRGRRDAGRVVPGVGCFFPVQRLGGEISVVVVLVRRQDSVGCRFQQAIALVVLISRFSLNRIDSFD